MYKKQRPAETWGLWVRENRTFYYLVTGPAQVTFNGDKIRSVLIRRNIIHYNQGHRLTRGTEPYLQMTLEDAIDKQYDIERIFLNNHVKTIVEAQEAAQEEVKSPWE